MFAKKTKFLAVAMTLMTGLLSAATPANADHRHRGYYETRYYPRYHSCYRPYYRPAYVAPPVVYSRPYVSYVEPVYVPRPVYYAPPPVVYSAPVIYPSGFGFSYGSRHRSFSFGVGY